MCTDKHMHPVLRPNKSHQGTADYLLGSLAHFPDANANANPYQLQEEEETERNLGYGANRLYEFPPSLKQAGLPFSWVEVTSLCEA